MKRMKRYSIGMAGFFLLFALQGCQESSPQSTQTPTTPDKPQAAESPVTQEKPQEASQPDATDEPAGPPKIRLVTNKGNIIIELNPDKAPITVENFLTYVNDGFFDGTVFHRVIPGFMIQGGGMTDQLVRKPTRAPIRNEAGNGLLNQRGTISMARTNNPDSATSQFFINVNDNVSLDYRGAASPGYAVFGQVVEGMDVADAIVSAPTKSVGGHRNVPVVPIYIEKAEIIE